MSIAAIRLEVARCLAQAKEHVGDAERDLASGDDEAKVRGARNLEFYRAQSAAFERRLAELDAHKDGAGASFVEGLKTEWMVQKQLFEEWSHRQKG